VKTEEMMKILELG